MSLERLELRLPADFVYADHPFIDHKKSSYVIMPDRGVDGDPNHGAGWKVTQPGEMGIALYDVAFFATLDQCLTFVQMITRTEVNPVTGDYVINYSYEETRPRSTVWVNG